MHSRKAQIATQGTPGINKGFLHTLTIPKLGIAFFAVTLCLARICPAQSLLPPTNQLDVVGISGFMQSIVGLPIENTSYTNWNGMDVTAVYTSTNGTIRYAAFRAPTADYTGPAPNLQLYQTAIIGMAQNNMEVSVIVAYQVWSNPPAPWLPDDMGSCHTWRLWGSPDPAFHYAVLCDCKTMQAMSDANDPMVFTMDGGPFNPFGQMFYRVTRD